MTIEELDAYIKDYTTTCILLLKTANTRPTNLAAHIICLWLSTGSAPRPTRLPISLFRVGQRHLRCNKSAWQFNTNSVTLRRCLVSSVKMRDLATTVLQLTMHSTLQPAITLPHTIIRSIAALSRVYLRTTLSGTSRMQPTTTIFPNNL